MSTALEQNLIQRVNVGDALTRSARRWGDKTAVVDGARSFSFIELDERVNRFANALMDRGVRVGDTVALYSGNCAEFLVTYFACAKIGAVMVPINLVWRASETAYVLKHASIRYAISQAAHVPLLREASDIAERQLAVIVLGSPEEVAALAPAERFDEVLEASSPDLPEVLIEDRSPLMYMYTSGTTSAPKGVVLSHLAVYMGALSCAHEMRFTEKDRLGSMMPLFHVAQLNAFATPTLFVGGTVVIMNGFEPYTLLRTIQEQKLTFIFALPKMYRELIDVPEFDDYDVSSLRRAGYAMAPIPKSDLLRGMEKLGCEFSLGFGQTEMTPTSTIFHPEHQLSHHGSVGTQIINVQIEIMDDDGDILPRGESGEIVYRGPQALEGYLDNPDATAEAMKYGWFHSGDLGRIDDDGVLWFEDRKKDVIKTGGENVSSLEVERALLEVHEDIKEVAVIGLPHPRWIEAITAVVIRHPGSTLDEAAIAEGLSSRLASFKRPKAIILADDLPRTATGKIQKNVLRRQHEDLFSSVEEKYGGSQSQDLNRTTTK